MDDMASLLVYYTQLPLVHRSRPCEGDTAWKINGYTYIYIYIHYLIFYTYVIMNVFSFLFSSFFFFLPRVAFQFVANHVDQCSRGESHVSLSDWFTSLRLPRSAAYI